MDSQDPVGLNELLGVVDEIDGVTASIVIMESYDVAYGLSAHDNPHDPLSLVTMHPKENYLHNGRLQQYIHAFRTHKVGAHMNMSFDKFIEQPRYVNRMILKECEEAERKEAKMTREIMSNLDSGQR